MSVKWERITENLCALYAGGVIVALAWALGYFAWKILEMWVTGAHSI